MASLQSVLLNATRGGSIFSATAPGSGGAFNFAGGVSGGGVTSQRGSEKGTNPRKFGEALEAARKPAAPEVADTKKPAEKPKNEAVEKPRAKGRVKEGKRPEKAKKRDEKFRKAQPEEAPQELAEEPVEASVATDESGEDVAPEEDPVSTDDPPVEATADEQAAAVSEQVTVPCEPVEAPELPEAPEAEEATNPVSAKVETHKSRHENSPELAKPEAPQEETEHEPETPETAENSGGKTKLAGFSPAKQARPAQDLPAQASQTAKDVHEAQASVQQITAGAMGEAVREAARPAGAAQDDAKPVPATPTVLNMTSGSPKLELTQSADAAPAAQQLPPEQQEQTFDQVVLGLRGKLDARNGKAEIQLNPPNLGTLHVSLSLSNGSLTAEFQSSSDLVRDLLKTHMEKLKNVLEGQGLAVDKLAVEPPPASPKSPVEQAGLSRTPANASPNNDGRSAGNFGRDAQAGQRRSPSPGTFGKFFRAGAKHEDAPIDVVA